MNHPTVLTCLLDHLTVGEMFRLRAALGVDGLDACEGAAALVETRLGLAHKRRRTLADLSQRMARLGCRECGAPSRRRSRVCVACATESGGYRELWSRRDIERAGGMRRADLLRLRVVARTCMGAYLYWRHEAQCALRRQRDDGAGGG